MKIVNVYFESSELAILDKEYRDTIFLCIH